MSNDHLCTSVKVLTSYIDFLLNVVLVIGTITYRNKILGKNYAYRKD